MNLTSCASESCAAMPVPRKVALFGKSMQASKFQFVAQVVETLCELGVTVTIESDFANLLAAFDNGGILNKFPRFKVGEEETDMAISIGGDGTFLSTAEKIGHQQVPILGVNTGRLGFLSDVMPESIATSLSQIIKGEYTLSRRSLIEVVVDDATFNVYPFALNEIAVLKHDNSSLIEVETHVNNQLLTNYLADGLIVSTPTGSTGYALSVGGPVLSPESPTFCVAPVAPHSLTMRPVILSDEVELFLNVKSRTGRFLIAIDGRSQSIPAGTNIRLRKASYEVAVVKTIGNDFFHTLRDKMMWGLDQRNG